jgi:transcriptional regulator with PAS, ATPase and Fis domain
VVDDPADSTLSLVGSRTEHKGGAVAHLFLVIDCDRPMDAPQRWALGDCQRVVIGRDVSRGSVRLSEKGVATMVVRQPDRWMSSVHARLEQVAGAWTIEDAGSKNGVFLNGARVTQAGLNDGDVIDLGHTVFLFRDALVDDGSAPENAEIAGLTTMSPELGQELSALPELAKSGISLVVVGESGTGKELIARAVHALSQRKGAFVAVNCGALPDTLIETELFGYRKGAFSGANEDRPGLIRAADGGTLFLDEIGDMPAPSQAALLRVLQEREVLPVGATRPLPVDVRVVAATHRDLDELVESGKFRGDLLARLAGHRVTLPPLKERREDLGVLVQALLRRLAPDRSEKLAFTIDATRALMLHDWPFNVRELEKALERALVMAKGERIEVEHLPEPLRKPAAPPRRAAAPDELSEEDRKRREELVALLEKHGGNVSAVAREMGKARMQIQRWMKRFGLR